MLREQQVMREAFLQLGVEIQKALSEHEENTQGAFVDCEQEKERKGNKGEPTLGLASSDGLIPPVRCKLTIGGNTLQVLTSRKRSWRILTGVHGAALHKFLPTIDEVGNECDGDDVLACEIGGSIYQTRRRVT